MTTVWSQLTPEQVVAMKGLGGDKGIFVRADVLRALDGDCNAAVMLSQYIYWSQSEQASDNDGWFFLTTAKVSKEFGITKRVQDRVKQTLSEHGLIEWERRGLPAKNYYRIKFLNVIKFIADRNYRLEQNVITDGTNRNDSGVTKSANIVNTEVRTKSKDIISTASRRYAKKDDVNVLGIKHDEFVAWVVKTYPISANGIPVTENQAKRAAKKFGGVPYNASDEKRAAAKEHIREFVLAINNLAGEVTSGKLETKYVPKFDNFAGLGVLYGKEPYYKAWAKKVAPPEPKRGLVV